MKLSVVIPVHNEAANIEPLIEELIETLNGKFDYEMIYVDDASTDNTPDQLKKMLKTHPRLRVITHRVCCGQSTAIFTGIQKASSPLIATLDGDMQNDPRNIPLLVDMYLRHSEEGEVMITGFRAKRHDTLWRKVSSRIANTVRQGILKDSTMDTGCGIKVFSRSFFLTLPYFDHMHRFLPALSKRAGAMVLSVPVNHRPRHHGVSNYGTLDRLMAGVVDLAGVFWLIKRFKNPEITEVTVNHGN